MTGLRKALGGVTKLTDAQASYDHFSRWQEETNAEKNHRGAAILLATNVENALQTAIVHLIEIKKGERSKLFGANCPFSSLANKITVAYALEIFGDETKRNLDIIRSVRNAFAHAKQPITFETEQIKRVCEFLAIPILLRPVAIPKDDGSHLTGRARFQRVCNAIAHNLLITSTHRMKFGIGRGELRFELKDGMHLVALPVPLL